MEKIQQRDGFTYVLTPISEAKPGDKCIAWNQDGERSIRVIESVLEGEAWWEGGHVKGYSVKYVGSEICSTAGRLFKFAKIIDEPVVCPADYECHGCWECLPNQVMKHEPWELEYCEQCGTVQLLVDCGSNHGYIGTVWWAEFSCGHSVMEEDGYLET